MTNVNKYLAVVHWAEKRYRNKKTGMLVISTGRMIDGKAGQVPSAYSRIESAAFEKYMRQPRDAAGCLIFQG